MPELPIRIPRVSVAVAEAIVQRFLVAEGGQADEGQPLFVIETEKVEMEIDAAVTGIVHWTASLGETYPIGQQIGSIQPA